VRAIVLFAFVLFSTCLAVPEADAHTRSESYSHWYLADRGITGTVTAPLREVMLLYQGADATVPPRDMFHDHLVANISVFAGETNCPLSSSNILQAASGFVRIELAFECGPATADSLRFRAMFEAAPAHVHYAKLHRDNLLLGEVLITDANDSWAFGSLESAATYSFASFLRIGVEHITGGIDHVAFLLGLLLIAGSVGRSIIAVTGFTLGHSISLAAAVLGYVHADGQLVEAFIGFTVALVAVEYFVLRRSDAHRFAMACLALAWLTGLVAVGAGFLGSRAIFAYAGFGVFAACYLLASRSPAMQDNRATILLFVATCCFGLVHGFGFAGFLMETGLLGTALLVPLLGFNLGVETGQLVLVAVAIVAGNLLKNHLPRALPQLAAAALCGIGVFWFVSRTIA
jgi:hypothetical protein